MACPRSARAPAGFTFAEVMIATVLVGMVVVAGLSTLKKSVETRRSLEDDPAEAFALAEEIHILALKLPRGPGLGRPATSGAEVTALNDLDRAVFSPPIDASGVQVGSTSDWPGSWAQRVTLREVDLARPDQVSPKATGFSRLVELAVTVQRRGVSQGTWRWWLTP